MIYSCNHLNLRNSDLAVAKHRNVLLMVSVKQRRPDGILYSHLIVGKVGNDLKENNSQKNIKTEDIHL